MQGQPIKQRNEMKDNFKTYYMRKYYLNYFNQRFELPFCSVSPLSSKKATHYRIHEHVTTEN